MGPSGLAPANGGPERVGGAVAAAGPPMAGAAGSGSRLRGGKPRGQRIRENLPAFGPNNVRLDTTRHVARH